jgi:CelD/BcsL family acetyltransferase involved in cellulose biosynthesis
VVDLIESAVAPLVAFDFRVQIATDIQAVATAWRGFEEYADCTVFQSFDWLAAWHKHIGAPAGVLPAIVTISSGRGDPLMILPLSVRKEGGLRHLTWLGDGLCDYNGPLLAPRFSSFVSGKEFAALWRRIRREIRSNKGLNFDLVALQRMPERIGTQTNPFLALRLLPNTFGAHIATLGTNWEEFYHAKRPARDRKVDRRKFRNLAKHGELRFIEPTDPGEIARSMDLLIRQKRESYGRIQAQDIFLRAGYQEFFKAISVQPGLSGIVHVTRLDVGEQPVATGFGLCFKSRYYLVLSSYEDNKLALYSPGRAHLCDMLRWAIARQYKLFDFTIGDEPYKREWSDIELHLFDLLEGATLIGRLSSAGKTAVRRANLFICKRPALRRPLSQIRLRLSAIRRGSASDLASSGGKRPSPRPADLD